MPKVLWKDEYLLDIYQAVADGKPRCEVAESLGVGDRTLADWVKSRPAVAEAVRRGRDEYDKRQTALQRAGNLDDYIAGRLSPDLRDLWEKMRCVDREDNPERILDALTAQLGKRQRQYLWLHALFTSAHFNPFEANRQTGVSPEMSTDWKKDPDFYALFGQINAMRREFVEGSLMKLIAAGDSPATIFAAKTLLRDRGYDVKTTLEIKGDVTSRTVDVAQILDKLPLEARLAVLQAIRAAQEPEPAALPAHNGKANPMPDGDEDED